MSDKQTEIEIAETQETTAAEDGTVTQIVIPEQRVKPVAFDPTDMSELYRYAGFVAKSELVPRALQGRPQNVLLVLLKGKELGLKPMQSLGNIHIVDGKAEIGSHLILALVLQSSHCEYFRLTEACGPDEGEVFATYATRRKGWPEGVEQTATWSIARAARAGLANKSNWKSHPLSMCKRRAQAELCRDVYPDVAMGMYDYGEIVEAIEQPEPEPEQEPTGGLKDRLRKRRESEATDEEPSDA